MSKLRYAIVFTISGFLAGVAFIVACNAPVGNGTTTMTGSTGSFVGPPTAAAQEACSQYQVSILDSSSITGEVTTLPAGWVPFAVAASTVNVVAYRCAP